jgi:hypothetical protein
MNRHQHQHQGQVGGRELPESASDARGVRVYKCVVPLAKVHMQEEKCLEA